MHDAQELTIVVVDDDEVDVRSITRSLRKRGIDNPIALAGNGLQALDLLRGIGSQQVAWPYVVLLDINMPGMNGIEFLEAIRADSELRRTVVFVLTTSDDQRDMLAAYENLVAGYIVKTDAGKDFIEVVSMLEQFSLTVRFPDPGGRMADAGSWSAEASPAPH
jgi:CheY-like chemotaxis protein